MVFSSFLYSFSLPNAKRLTIKTFLEVTLISLTLRARTVFLYFWKKAGNCFTGLLDNGKLVHLEAEIWLVLPKI